MISYLWIEYWTYLNTGRLRVFICFCAGHTVARKYLASTNYKVLDSAVLGGPPKPAQFDIFV